MPIRVFASVCLAILVSSLVSHDGGTQAVFGSRASVGRQNQIIVDDFISRRSWGDAVDRTVWSVLKTGIGVPRITVNRGRAWIATGPRAGNSIMLLSRRKVRQASYTLLRCTFRLKASHARGAFEWEAGLEDSASAQTVTIWKDPDINLVLLITSSGLRLHSTALDIDPTREQVFVLELRGDGSEAIASVNGIRYAVHRDAVPRTLDGAAKIAVAASDDIGRLLVVDHFSCAGWVKQRRGLA